MKNKADENEINLYETILVIKNGKYKIFFITIIFLLIGLIYQSLYVDKSKQNVSISEIKPISSFENSKYDSLNYFITENSKFKTDTDYLLTQYLDEYFEKKKVPNTNKSEIKHNLQKKKLQENIFYEINKKYLHNLFVELLQEKTFLLKVTKQFFESKKEDYKNENDYKKAVLKYVDSVELLKPLYPKDLDEEVFPNWRIRHQTTKDLNDWNNFLEFLEKSINLELQSYIKDKFKNYVYNLEKLIEYQIEDLDNSISNSIDNYDINIKKRIAFLEEQALIARKLNIQKYELILSEDPKDDASEISLHYYLRGYEMIEKEIELILNRENKELFIDDLSILRKQRKKLTQNKDLQRLEKIFQNTPIANSKEFVAASITNNSTFVINKSNAGIKIIILASIIGAVVGIFYVFISRALKRYENI